jgi:hypothetical protein
MQYEMMSLWNSTRLNVVKHQSSSPIAMVQFMDIDKVQVLILPDSTIFA